MAFGVLRERLQEWILAMFDAALSEFKEVADRLATIWTRSSPGTTFRSSASHLETLWELNEALW